MRYIRPALTLIALLLFTPHVQAGLYYSGEIINELPARWQGFIQDQRLLRNVARKPTPQLPASTMRKRYQQTVKELQQKAEKEKLTADELADLGALNVRLGNFTEAVSVLRQAARAHPRHFHLQANLGTAWQMLGELRFASVHLEEAVELAPKEMKQAEKLHLKLVQSRMLEKEDAEGIDKLFDVRFGEDQSAYKPGTLAKTDIEKLPANVTALVQQLALWLPADGRLLWLLAELASAHGDIRISAAMMDGCVSEFLMRDRELRQHRLVMKQAAQEILKRGPDTKANHNKHPFPFKATSSRALANRFFQRVLPAINPKGVNPLFWEVVTQTSVDRHYRPTFPKYLKGLDGMQIEMKGYVQPLLGSDLEMTSFLLIEYPVGCWYCEVPELTAMIYVELPLDKSLRFTRDLVEIRGKLKLNSTDPEDFLYQLQSTEVKVVGQ